MIVTCDRHTRSSTRARSSTTRKTTTSSTSRSPAHGPTAPRSRSASRSRPLRSGRRPIWPTTPQSWTRPSGSSTGVRRCDVELPRYASYHAAPVCPPYHLPRVPASTRLGTASNCASAARSDALIVSPPPCNHHVTALYPPDATIFYTCLSRPPLRSPLLYYPSPYIPAAKPHCVIRSPNEPISWP